MSNKNLRPRKGWPIVQPKLCDGVPISGQQNLGKLMKGQRQERMKERGYRFPHNRAAWLRFFEDRHGA